MIPKITLFTCGVWTKSNVSRMNMNNAWQQSAMLLTLCNNCVEKVKKKNSERLDVSGRREDEEKCFEMTEKKLCAVCTREV